MQVKEQHYYTPEEYLELEASATFRSEYYEGKIFPMAGGTPNHNQISLNLSSALNFALKGQPYDVFMSDMRLWIPLKRLYTYPDVMVVAGQLEFAPGRRDTITNPVMIAEVLSVSTEKYDRVGKFKLYRGIPSFKEYILISQTEIYVEQYSKAEDNKWLFSEYEGEDALLALTSIPFQVSLLDLYDKVEFESEPSE
ncbi:MAG: Uma2 family endonuclease [Coleofasciculus sp. S288]|nr:Uma2 family endonuclease [Coleofasciculus sp. S288]